MCSAIRVLAAVVVLAEGARHRRQKATDIAKTKQRDSEQNAYFALAPVSSLDPSINIWLQDALAFVRCCNGTETGPCASAEPHEYGGCHGLKNWTQAQATCQSHGLNLCSKEQLHGGFSGTGCGYDGLIVWSGTTASAEEVVEPIPEGFYVAAPDSKLSAMVAPRERTGLAYVRCCKGLSSKGDARVNEDDYGGCGSLKTWQEADDICEKKQYNLCSKEQMHDGFAKKHGCDGHQDSWLHWTQSETAVKPTTLCYEKQPGYCDGGGKWSEWHQYKTLKNRTEDECRHECDQERKCGAYDIYGDSCYLTPPGSKGNLDKKYSCFVRKEC